MKKNDILKLVRALGKAWVKSASRGARVAVALEAEKPPTFVLEIWVSPRLRGKVAAVLRDPEMLAAAAEDILGQGSHIHLQLDRQHEREDGTMIACIALLSMNLTNA